MARPAFPPALMPLDEVESCERLEPAVEEAEAPEVCDVDEASDEVAASDVARVVLDATIEEDSPVEVFRDAGVDVSATIELDRPPEMGCTVVMASLVGSTVAVAFVVATTASVSFADVVATTAPRVEYPATAPVKVGVAVT